MDPEEFHGTLGVNHREVKRSDRSNPLPPARSDGISQNQAVQEWGTNERKLYLLEQLGRLFSIRWGNKVIYSRAQLVDVLGEPTGTRPPGLKRRDNRSDATGG